MPSGKSWCRQACTRRLPGTRSTLTPVTRPLSVENAPPTWRLIAALRPVSAVRLRESASRSYTARGAALNRILCLIVLHTVNLRGSGPSRHRAGARSSRNVRQPNHVIDDHIAGHQVERGPRAGEEWRATTKHDGAEVKAVLIDQTGLGQAVREDRPANVNLASQLGLQPAYHLLDVLRDNRGVGAN